MRNYIGLTCIFLLMGCGQDAANSPSPAPTPIVKAAPDPTQEWRFSDEKDELTDESITSATLLAKDGHTTTFIAVRCIKGQLDILTSFDEYLGNDHRPVKYRMDQGDIQKDDWLPTSKGNALFIGQDADFSRQLLKSKKLIIEADDFRGVAHRTKYEWNSGEDVIRSVMIKCNTPIEGIESRLEGIRKEIALEMERWGPKYIEAHKRSLVQAGSYKGPIDTTIDQEFATAVQSIYDRYISRCKEGKVKGPNCTVMRVFLDAKMEPRMPPVGAVLYEIAAKSLQKDMGSLRISD